MKTPAELAQRIRQQVEGEPVERLLQAVGILLQDVSILRPDPVRGDYVPHGGPAWLDVSQAADYLQVCERTLRTYVADGRVQVHRVGNLLRFRAEWLDSIKSPSKRRRQVRR